MLIYLSDAGAATYDQTDVLWQFHALHQEAPDHPKLGDDGRYDDELEMASPINHNWRDPRDLCAGSWLETDG